VKLDTQKPGSPDVAHLTRARTGDQLPEDG